MTTERWRPLSVRTSGNVEQYDALHEGVMDWIRPALMVWVMGHFLGSENKPDVASVHTVEIKLKTSLGDPYGTNPRRAYVNLLSRMSADPRLFLDVIDLALSQTGGKDWEALEGFLREGGSAWAVAPDGLGLTRRVLPEIAAAAKAEVDHAGRAGELLAQAWRYVYGREPNPSEGYHSAVKAVEAAAILVVTPNDTSATLGRVIGELRANLTKFKSVFIQSGEGVKAALDLADVVWKSHHDRHGTPDESKPISVSPEEAEAALHAALLLVHWFRAGAILRKTS